jgi:hypothetical protein
LEGRWNQKTVDERNCKMSKHIRKDPGDGSGPIRFYIGDRK